MTSEERYAIDSEVKLLKNGVDNYATAYDIENLQYLAAGEEADDDSPLKHLPTDGARVIVSLRGEPTRSLILKGDDAERAWDQFIGTRFNRFGRRMTARSQRARDEKQTSATRRTFHPPGELLQRYVMGVIRSERQQDRIREHVDNCEECHAAVRILTSRVRPSVTT